MPKASANASYECKNFMAIFIAFCAVKMYEIFEFVQLVFAFVMIKLYSIHPLNGHFSKSVAH